MADSGLIAAGIIAAADTVFRQCGADTPSPRAASSPLTGTMSAPCAQKGSIKAKGAAKANGPCMVERGYLPGA